MTAKVLEKTLEGNRQSVLIRAGGIFFAIERFTDFSLTVRSSKTRLEKDLLGRYILNDGSFGSHIVPRGTSVEDFFAKWAENPEAFFDDYPMYRGYVLLDLTCT